MPLRLGKKPAREGAVKLKFSSFFSPSQLPTPPLVFGKPNLITNWGMLLNDQISCCVISGAAHEIMLWNAEVGNQIPEFINPSIIQAYSECAGYIPGNPETDQGTDMQQAASYRRKAGIKSTDGINHKVDSYVALKVGDPDELALAAYIFGAVGIGLMMPSSAMGQFDRAEPWVPVKGSTTDGGHYVPIVGRNSHGNFIAVTWGRLQALSEDFIRDRMDEGIAYLTSDWVGKPYRGYDEDALRAALTQL